MYTKYISSAYRKLRYAISQFNDELLKSNEALNTENSNLKDENMQLKKDNDILLRFKEHLEHELNSSKEQAHGYTILYETKCISCSHHLSAQSDQSDG